MPFLFFEFSTRKALLFAACMVCKCWYDVSAGLIKATSPVARANSAYWGDVARMPFKFVQEPVLLTDGVGDFGLAVGNYIDRAIEFDGIGGFGDLLRLTPDFAERRVHMSAEEAPNLGLVADWHGFGESFHGHDKAREDVRADDRGSIP